MEQSYLYHLSDGYFEVANDEFLMSNKENGGYRPHFLAIKATEHIYWMVPISSKCEKYGGIYKKQVEKYGKCTKIAFGLVSGERRAFLVQNAFPIHEKWIDHVHSKFGAPVQVAPDTVNLVVNNLKTNIAMHRHGRKVFFTDVDRLMQIAKDEESPCG